MHDVLVLGCSGMLGSMMIDYLSRNPGIRLAGTLQRNELVKQYSTFYPKVEFEILEAANATEEQIKSVVSRFQWIVNCIGIVKTVINDRVSNDVIKALKVNALFPHKLSKVCRANGSIIIQIATDCVYSGKSGFYTEEAFHDPLDVYGKTKSLGEVTSENVYNLRCSIVGSGFKSRVHLLQWFLGQVEDATINGFVNHFWNGVTTLHFAKICESIILNQIGLPHVLHLVPKSIVTKADMLEHFARSFHREDIQINRVAAPIAINRSLETLHKALNSRLWEGAGYDFPPSVEEMISELARYDYSANAHCPPGSASIIQ